MPIAIVVSSHRVTHCSHLLPSLIQLLSDYLLAGKGADLYLVGRTMTKFTNIKVVRLSTIHSLLLGKITLEDLGRISSLTKEDCKDRDSYIPATTIPPNLSDSSSGLEKAIDELAVWPGHRRDERTLRPLFEILGYPNGYNDKQPSSAANGEEAQSSKKQKTG